MSVNAKAHVVCGFKFGVRKHTKVTKKYNEDTGKPYFKEEQRGWEIYDKYGFCLIVGEDDIFESVCGLDCFLKSYQDTEEIILGESIAESGDIMYGGGFWTFDELAIPNAVGNFADKYNIGPSLFLVTRIS